MDFPYGYNVTYTACVEVEGKFYFSSNLFNGLFTADKDSVEPTFVCMFPNEKSIKANIHTKAFLYKNFVVFVPGFGKNIALFNPEDTSIDSVELPFTGARVMDSVMLSGDILRLFYAETTEGIVDIDLQAKKIKSIKLYSEILIIDGLNHTKQAICNNVAKYKNQIVAIFQERNSLLFSDNNLEDTKIVPIEFKKYPVGLCTLGDDIYIYFANDFNLYKIDECGNVKEAYQGECLFDTNRKVKYSKVVSAGNSIILLPEGGSSFLKVDFKDKKIVPFGNIDIDWSVCAAIMNKNKWKAFNGTMFNGEKVIVFPYRNGISYILDLGTDTIEEHSMVFDKEKAEEMFRNNQKRVYAKEKKEELLQTETMFWGLQEFVNNLFEE